MPKKVAASHDPLDLLNVFVAENPRNLPTAAHVFPECSPVAPDRSPDSKSHNSRWPTYQGRSHGSARSKTESPHHRPIPGYGTWDNEESEISFFPWLRRI